MTAAGMIPGAMTILLAQDDDRGWIQLVFVIIVVVVMLIGKLVQRASQKQRAQEPPREYTPPPPPRQRDKLSEVRAFFEDVQQQEKRAQTPATARQMVQRHRSVIPAEAPDGEEGPAAEQGMTLVEALRAQKVEQAQALPGVAAKVERPLPSMELEDLVGDVRLSPLARAVLLTEIIGLPRACRPYSPPTDER